MTAAATTAPLSPEADFFLDAAATEFNQKQQAMAAAWNVLAYQQWSYQQSTGHLRLQFPDGTEWEAEAQILGSYLALRQSWEWAWNNPHIDPPAKQDSRLVRQVGERLGLNYLIAGQVPIPSEEFISFLCSIGLKATAAMAIFRGRSGLIDVLLTIKNPRWLKAPAPSTFTGVTAA